MSFEKIIVIDFETTGVSSDKRAVEIAWFELNRKLEIVDEQSSLINPQIPIPRRATAVHKITDQMVHDLPLFRKYCGGVTELCTLKLARAVFPNLHNHKLGTISESFGFINESAHRARSDAMQVVHFLELVESAHGIGIDGMIARTGKRRPSPSHNGRRATSVKPKIASENKLCSSCFLLVNRGLRACPLDDSSCPLFV